MPLKFLVKEESLSYARRLEDKTSESLLNVVKVHEALAKLKEVAERNRKMSEVKKCMEKRKKLESEVKELEDKLKFVYMVENKSAREIWVDEDGKLTTNHSIRIPEEDIPRFIMWAASLYMNDFKVGKGDESTDTK